MSGSPKYSHASWDSEAAARLARAAREEEARREAERARLLAEERARQLAKGREQAMAAVKTAQATLGPHLQAPYARFVGPSLAELEREVLALARRCTTADLGDLALAASELARWRERLQTAASAGRAGLAAEQARISAERAALAVRIATVEAGLSNIPVQDGLSAGLARTALVEARALVPSSAVPNATAAVQRAEQALRELVVQADAAEARAAVRLTLLARERGDVESRLAVLQRDEAVTTWAPDELRAAGELLARAQGGGSEALEHLTSAGALLNSALARANAAQASELRRAELVGGLIAVLREQGFFVENPTLLGESQDAPVSILARRADARALEVAVGLQGDVRYEVHGFPRREESTSTTCDEAVSTLESLAARLNEACGATLAPPWWEGHPTATRPEAAAPLPRSLPVERSRS